VGFFSRTDRSGLYAGHASHFVRPANGYEIRAHLLERHERTVAGELEIPYGRKRLIELIAIYCAGHWKSEKWVLVVSRGKYEFKQSDIARALRATKAAGVGISEIEIEPDGRMVIVLSDGKAKMTDDDCSDNPWDNET
jgi:hypothetical protein